MSGSQIFESRRTGRAGDDSSRRSPRTLRGRLRRGLLLVIGLLYVASVPWYRESGAPLVLFLGLPDWVAVALGCYIAVALLNAWAWGLTEFSDEDPPS